MWIRGNAAFEPIISEDLFGKAQKIICDRSRRFSNDELLEQLRNLLRREGRLSGLLIDDTEGMPSSSVYRHRFTSLIHAYTLISYTPERDYQFIETNRRLRLMHPAVITNVRERIGELGGSVIADPVTDLLSINGEFTASVVLARCTQTHAGALRWQIRIDSGLKPDITVAVRMDQENRNPLDYYLLPRLDLIFEKLVLSEDNQLNAWTL
jgi:hypothetical protein